MELSETASWVLVIGYLIWTLIMAAAFAGIAWALFKVNAKLEELMAKADPLLAKTDNLLTITNDKVASIGDRTEDILAQGEEVAENVHQKVDKTATAVQRAVHAPIIGWSSLAAGVSRGVETFARLQGPSNGSGGATRPAGTPDGAAVSEVHVARTAEVETTAQNGREVQEVTEVTTVSAGKENE